MKEANFTVRASGTQSVRWKMVAEEEGFRSVGAWLAGVADAYLKARSRAVPLPLAWRRKARFSVHWEDGTKPEVFGWIARPFGIFRGDLSGPRRRRGAKLYSLAYLPTGRIVATLRTAHCKALASELARLWVRWGEGEPTEDPTPIIDRHRREDL